MKKYAVEPCCEFSMGCRQCYRDVTENRVAFPVGGKSHVGGKLRARGRLHVDGNLHVRGKLTGGLDIRWNI